MFSNRLYTLTTYFRSKIIFLWITFFTLFFYFFNNYVGNWRLNFKISIFSMLRAARFLEMVKSSQKSNGGKFGQVEKKPESCEEIILSCELAKSLQKSNDGTRRTGGREYDCGLARMTKATRKTTKDYAGGREETAARNTYGNRRRGQWQWPGGWRRQWPGILTVVARNTNSSGGGEDIGGREY